MRAKLPKRHLVELLHQQEQARKLGAMREILRASFRLSARRNARAARAARSESVLPVPTGSRHSIFSVLLSGWVFLVRLWSLFANWLKTPKWLVPLSGALSVLLHGPLSARLAPLSSARG